MKIGQLIGEIERHRGSRVLVLAASNLDLDFLPPLYDTLREIGRTARFDLLCYCRGGMVTAARRIALLLDEHTDRLSFIVPDRCASSGTIAALAAREIVAGEAAIFSPVDPLLQGPGDGGPAAISAQDVRLFGAMSRDWFGLDEKEARERTMTLLCESIFPTALTGFYRSTLEVESVCLELLSLHMPDDSGEAKARIVDGLLHGHHSHGFALGRADLARLGLPIAGDPAAEDLAWEVARELRRGVGGGARGSVEEDWIDGLLATRERAWRRRCSPEALGPAWEAGEIE
jgi:hypothetical protein